MSCLTDFLNEGNEKKSRPGVYEGYSKRIYDGWKRFSCYAQMRDGVKLAADIYRPTLGGEVVETPLPVVFRFTPYGRVKKNAKGDLVLTTCFDGTGTRDKKPDAYCEGGGEDDPGTGAELMCKEFTARGYVLVSADTRGRYGSFGLARAIHPIEDSEDAYDIIQWIARQSWCDGNVGMYGFSHNGATQMEALRACPPALKCAVIGMTDFNKYDGWVRGGIPRETAWPWEAKYRWKTDVEQRLAKDLDYEGIEEDPEYQAGIGTDDDTDGSVLRDAARLHKLDGSFIPAYERGEDEYLPMWEFNRLPYRDSYSSVTDNKYFEYLSHSNYIDDINRSGVAVYLLGGWYDIWSRDTVITYNNLTLPKKMLIGPWHHRRSKASLNLVKEHLRFYDYWLKGIDNGIMTEPPIHYQVLGSDDEWKDAESWPVPGIEMTSYFLHSDKSGSAPSANDGVLNRTANAAFTEYDEYTSDYSIQNGEDNMIEPVDIEQKGLTYTTEPLEEDMEICGHPLLQFWFSSTGWDGDFFAFLLDVDENGDSIIASEGMLRASMREEEPAPYNYLGLPWHPCRKGDVHLLRPGETVRMRIDLKPTCQRFKKGHRIRLVLTTARAEYMFHKESPEPVVRVHHDQQYTAYLHLPVVR